MRHIRANYWVIGLASLALTSSVACQRDEPAEPTPMATPAPTSPVEDETRSDSGITTAVQARFYSDQNIRGRGIDVSTENGVVTLSGTVDTESVKQQAVQLARGVNGVTRVEDRLDVKAAASDTVAPAAGRPSAPVAERREEADEGSPGWITTKIQAQYYVNPEIKPWNIDVSTTSGGVVTLRGEVEEENDRQEAVRIARGTDGVTRVEDRLRVKAQGATADRDVDMTQPDPWVTAKIQSKYFLDDEVRARNINVDTNNGVVTLEGTVGSEAEKRQAMALARNTDGVKEVRDQLTITPEGEPTKTVAEDTREAARGAVDRLSDGWITTKIQSQYFLDDEIKGADINVDTMSGVVTLKGSVESEAASKSAEAIARDTEGVTKVVNELQVAATAKQ